MNPSFVRFRTYCPIPGTEGYDALLNGDFEQLSETEHVQEMRDMIAALGPGCTSVVTAADHIGNLVAVEAKLPASTEPSCLSLHALEKRATGNSTVAKLAQVLASSAIQKMTLKRRQHLMACAAYRAGAAISSNLATGSTDAMHADRRLFMLAASDLEGRPLHYFIDACANALVEAQRAAKYLIYLHVSKAAGTSLCKLASRNRCKAPPRFSTLWAPGDGFDAASVPSSARRRRDLSSSHRSDLGQLRARVVGGPRGQGVRGQRAAGAVRGRRAVV